MRRASTHKTARATGLAIAIVGGGEGVPAFLKAKRVLSLDMGLLIAGAKERGELELRVTRLLQETRDAGDVILMCGCLGLFMHSSSKIALHNATPSYTA